MNTNLRLALVLLLFTCASAAQTGVGQRGVGNWYSLEKEVAIGRQYSAQLESQLPVLKNEKAAEFLNRVTQRLVRNSDEKLPVSIKILDSDQVLVIALPGGFLYISKGALRALGNEGELAGVLGHFMAHIAARHATRQATRAQLANLGSLGMVFVIPGAGAVPVTFVSFSREFETEADYLGAQYVYKSGLDPRKVQSAFDKLVSASNVSGQMSKTLATHILTADRVQKLQAEITEVLPQAEFAPVSAAEYEEFKAELEQPGNSARTSEGPRLTKPVPQISQLSLVTQPGSVQAYVDEAFKGITSEQEGTLKIENLTPGSHRLRLTLPGYKEWNQNLTLSAGETVPVQAKLEPAGPKPLSEAEIEEALTNGMGNKRTAELVDKFGVDFTLTNEIRAKLRQAGADDKLLLEIATNKK